jgi:hypothetical protein
VVADTAPVNNAEQYRQWAANARAWAAELPQGADRDTLLYIARSYEEKARRLEHAKEAAS